MVKRALDPGAAFLEQGQLQPYGRRGGGQRHADLQVTAWREGPIERRAQIVNLTPVVAEPFGREVRVQFSFGQFEETPVIFRVATREPFAFAGFSELLKHVGASRIEQPVAPTGSADLCHNERLRDQAEKAVGKLPANRFRRSPRQRWPPSG